MSANNAQGRSAETSLISAARQEAAELAKGAEAPELPPNAIPGFTLVRRLGRGGMGVVYQARQRDPPRDVALKVMRAGGSLKRERLALFRQEVETLARFSHPNIAAIHGSGRTESGQHYFVMELVRGVRLTEYARLEQLSLRDQLEPFRKVCEAVQYAHQSGVVHRDLKPSNILVDAEGNPKVVDFGLAWIEDANGPIQKLSANMGTWPYVSPEQASSRTDVINRFATDVYSLGVILYELLTEQLPYDVTAADPEEARRIICETIPPRPSTHRPSLPGDLDSIVMRALEKDPADRYPTPAALSEDIARHLTYQPVQAHPQRATYRFAKLVKRHEALAAYIATLVVLAVGFGLWQRQLYAEEKQRRIDEQQQQRELAKWQIAEMSKHNAEVRAIRSELAAAREQLVHMLFERGELTVAEALLREWLSIARATHSEVPGVAALWEGLLGECLTALGQYDEASSLLEDSYALAAQGDQPEHSQEAQARMVSLYVRRGWDKVVAWWAGLEAQRDEPEESGGPGSDEP